MTTAQIVEALDTKRLAARERAEGEVQGSPEANYHFGKADAFEHAVNLVCRHRDQQPPVPTPRSTT